MTCAAAKMTELIWIALNIFVSKRDATRKALKVLAPIAIPPAQRRRAVIVRAA